MKMSAIADKALSVVGYAWLAGELLKTRGCCKVGIRVGVAIGWRLMAGEVIRWLMRGMADDTPLKIILPLYAAVIAEEPLMRISWLNTPRHYYATPAADYVTIY